MANIQQLDRIEAVVTELESIQRDYIDHQYEVDMAIRNLSPVIDEDAWGH